jgi:hypothetical protein
MSHSWGLPSNLAKRDVWECEGEFIAQRQEREDREALHYQRVDNGYRSPRAFYFLMLTLLVAFALGVTVAHMMAPPVAH